jgi:hypothetical protein
MCFCAVEYTDSEEALIQKKSKMRDGVTKRTSSSTMAEEEKKRRRWDG